jgi:hypothetical protein
LSFFEYADNNIDEPMNIPTIILVVLIAAAVAGAIVGIFRKHRKHKGCCDDCDAQGCALRPLLSKKQTKQ